jgi:hypothetical protein
MYYKCACIYLIEPNGLLFKQFPCFFVHFQNPNIFLYVYLSLSLNALSRIDYLGLKSRQGRGLEGLDIYFTVDVDSRPREPTETLVRAHRTYAACKTEQSPFVTSCETMRARPQQVRSIPGPFQ